MPSKLAALKKLAQKHYNPAQPRDATGKWASGAGAKLKPASPDYSPQTYVIGVKTSDKLKAIRAKLRDAKNGKVAAPPPAAKPAAKAAQPKAAKPATPPAAKVAPPKTHRQIADDLAKDPQTHQFISLLTKGKSDRQIRQTLNLSQDEALHMSAKIRKALEVRPDQRLKDRLAEIYAEPVKTGKQPIGKATIKPASPGYSPQTYVVGVRTSDKLKAIRAKLREQQKAAPPPGKTQPAAKTATSKAPAPATPKNAIAFQSTDQAVQWFNDKQHGLSNSISNNLSGDRQTLEELANHLSHHTSKMGVDPSRIQFNLDVSTEPYHNRGSFRSGSNSKAPSVQEALSYTLLNSQAKQERMSRQAADHQAYVASFKEKAKLIAQKDRSPKAKAVVSRLKQGNLIESSAAIPGIDPNAALVSHELGHAFHYWHQDKVIAAFGPDAAYGAKSAVTDQLVAKYAPSEYGFINWRETFAESMALYANNQLDRVHPDLVKFFRSNTTYGH